MSVTLLSSDQQEFIVSKDDIEISGTIKNMLEEHRIAGFVDAPIELKEVDGHTLKKVVDYLAWRRNHTKETIEWNARNADNNELFSLAIAANYLEIKPLLIHACGDIAKLIKGKTPDEIRRNFGITNDFTPAEEVENAKENRWFSSC